MGRGTSANFALRASRKRLFFAATARSFHRALGFAAAHRSQPGRPPWRVPARVLDSLVGFDGRNCDIGRQLTGYSIGGDIFFKLRPWQVNQGITSQALAVVENGTSSGLPCLA